MGRKIQRKAQKREESVYKRLQNYQRENTDKQMKQVSKNKDEGAQREFAEIPPEEQPDNLTSTI